MEPCLPLIQVTFSHSCRKHSSGRMPLSTSTVALSASSEDAAARYFASSAGRRTTSRCRSPDSNLNFGALSISPHSTARWKTRRRRRKRELTAHRGYFVNVEEYGKETAASEGGHPFHPL